MPTATDLVTDLPADFEVFGQAVATSMADLLGGTSGQVLAKNSNTDMDFVWVTTDDTNAIQNAIVDAKGDLIAASAADTPARLAVGTSGQVLVADSTASTGLKWAASGNFIGARVYPSSAQTISTATDTVINFNTELFDTNSFHDNSTNNSRFTIPAGLGGYYKVSGSIRFDQNGTGRRFVVVTANGAGIAVFEFTPASGVYLSLPFEVIVGLIATDYVQVAVYQQSGGNLNTLANYDSTFFQIERLGA